MKTNLTLVLLLSFSCSKQNEAAAPSASHISLNNVTHMRLSSNFGFVPCFPSENFELNNNSIHYTRNLEVDCPESSLDTTLEISQIQKDSLYTLIQSMTLIGRQISCPSDAPSNSLTIYNDTIETKYGTSACSADLNLKFDDFNAIKAAFRKIFPD